MRSDLRSSLGSGLFVSRFRNSPNFRILDENVCQAMRSSRPRPDPFAALSPAGQSQRSMVETAHDVDMLRCPAVDKDWELISQLAYNGDW